MEFRTSKLEEDIEELWVILNGGINQTMKIDNLKTAFICMGLILSDDEIYRVKKDRNLLNSTIISINDFKQIARVKLKSRDLDIDIEKTIKGFKNKNDMFNRNNINEVLGSMAILEINRKNSKLSFNTHEDLDLIRMSTKTENSGIEYNNTNDSDDVITIDDIMHFCRSSGIKSSKEEVAQLVKNINQNGTLNLYDVKYLYRKTNLI